MSKNRPSLQYLSVALLVAFTGLATPLQGAVVTGSYTARTQPFFGSMFFTTVADGQLASSQGNAAFPLPAPIDEFVTSNPTFGGAFAYDTAAGPTLNLPNARLYPGTLLNGDFILPGGSPASLSVSTPLVSVWNSPGNDSFSSEAQDGLPAELDAIDLSNAAPQSFSYDLMQDPSFAAGATGLPAVAAMPVRLTESAQVRASSYHIVLRDTTGAVFSSTSLPSQLDLADFTGGPLSIILISYEYELAIQVEPSDYDVPADYQAVADFIATSQLSIRATATLNAPLTALSASSVPEPTALVMAMIPAVLFLRRCRQA